MIERQFDSSGAGSTGSAGSAGSSGDDNRRCYDYELMCDELRCHSSESLHLLRLTAAAKGQLSPEQRTPSVEDPAARREARELKYRWNRDSGMLDGRFSLPDIDGATFESALDEMIEKMKPAADTGWDTRDHRGADALVELCRLYRNGSRLHDAPTTGAQPHFIVEVPLTGPATVAGVPLPDAMVERLRAQARNRDDLPKLAQLAAEHSRADSAA